MGKDSIEGALSVLESEKGNLSPEQYSRLAELARAGRNVRVEITDTLAKRLELRAQYSTRLDTLKHYGFLTEAGEAKDGDKKLPTYEEAMATFKLEEFEIASHFQKPTFLLIPETSFAVKVKALDAHKQGEQVNNTIVSGVFRESDSGYADIITGWRTTIVDGAQEMENYIGDKSRLPIDSRIEKRKAARKYGEKGMERHRYALLMMEALREGNPVDRGLCTVLDDDPILSYGCYKVPYAYIDTIHLRLSFLCFDRRDIRGGRMMFRSSVGGDELLI